MITEAEVAEFLSDFHQKMNIMDIIFEDREKNKQALLDLEITARERLNYIRNLKTENYYKGPNKDTNDTSAPDYWEFGVNVKGREVYVKINMGRQNKPVICISFHIAEFPIVWPYKK